MARIRKSKGEDALAVIVPNLISLVQSVSVIERCSALAVANALLLKAASHWGREITHQPMKIGKGTAQVLLDVLYEQYVKLEAAFDSTDGSSVDDVYVMACKWEMVATQVVMVTIGASLSREYANAARQVWILLGKSRVASKEAVKALMEYNSVYQVSPVPLPLGREVNRGYLMSLATSLPPIFSPRKKDR